MSEEAITMTSGEPSRALLVSMLKEAAKLEHCLLTSYIYTALGHLDSEELAVREHRSTRAQDGGSKNGLEIFERVKTLQLPIALEVERVEALGQVPEPLACRAPSPWPRNLARGAPVVLVEEGLLVEVGGEGGRR